MDRKTFAIYTLILGALVGVIGDVLFYGKTVGVSFPLFVGIAIVVVLASAGLMRLPVRLRNLWVLAPALFFAAMVAVRADEGINLLNVMAALALGALALHYLPLGERLDFGAVRDHVLAVLDASFGAVIAPILETLDSISWVFGRLDGNWRTVAAVGRGLVITAPVVLVFALLFSAADAVFAGYVDNIVALLRFPLYGDQLFHLAFIGGIAWVSCGAGAFSTPTVRIVPSASSRRSA